jgi:hypothetical protein
MVTSKSTPWLLRSLATEACRCGAKTRKGTPCRCTWTYANGRCRFHGGLSTGPKTEEGWRRALSNLKQFREAAREDPIQRERVV